MVYDIAIIGGGCAGSSSAMYAARMNLKTVLFSEVPGGLITTTHIVENWPGIITQSGPDLGIALYNHAKAVGADMRNEMVREVSREKKCFNLKTKSGEYESKTVVFATGSHHRTLNVPGEKELTNKGVSYCALCDGAFYKGKEVAVAGGGDSAAKEALYLSEVGKHVTVFVRGNELKAEPANFDLVQKKKDKITVLYHEEIAEVLGKDHAEGVRLKSGKAIKLDGLFVAIGQIPNTDLAKNLGVKLNDYNEIIINRKSETNVPGVYAAGDCVDNPFKQAITGAAEGVTAAYYAFTYVQENGAECVY